jgi:hypothetical protein
VVPLDEEPMMKDIDRMSKKLARYIIHDIDALRRHGFSAYTVKFHVELTIKEALLMERQNRRKA